MTSTRPDCRRGPGASGAEANGARPPAPDRRFDRFGRRLRTLRVIDRPEASVPAVVRLRSAVCLLGRFPALAGVDLDVAAGEIVLLSGANGAGKTTLLRLLAGLVPLYSGRPTVLGHDLAHDRRSARRDLALVGHETFCYDDLTVRENLRSRRGPSGRDAAAADDGARAARARRGGRRRAPAAVGRAAPPPRARGRARARPAAAAPRRAPRRARRRGPRGARRGRARRRRPRAAPCCSRRTSSSTPAAARRPRGRARRRARPRGGAARRRRRRPTSARARAGARRAATPSARCTVNALARGAARRGQGPAHRGAARG